MRPSERTSSESGRLTYALLLSLLIHASLLMLKFGAQGLGLPAFGLPWQDRRVEADLRVALVPAPVTVAEPPVPPIAEPSLGTLVEQPVAQALTLPRSASRAPATVQLAPAIVPEVAPKAEASEATEASPNTEAHPTTEANPLEATAPSAVTAKAPARSRPSRNQAPPPSPAPAVIALEPRDRDTWVVLVAPVVTPLIAPALSALSSETPLPSARDAGDAAQAPMTLPAPAARIEPAASGTAVELNKLDVSRQDARRQAEQLEAALQEAARQATALQQATRQQAARKQIALQEAARREAQRQEVARQGAALQEASRQVAAQQEAALQESARQAAALQEAAREEAARQEAAMQEAARQEAARQEAAQEEAARQEAARREAARQEAARIEAARVEAARVEAARAEAARIEAERAEAARQETASREAARQEAARQEAQRKDAARIEAQEAEARREARLRAIGRQLDEEAAQREAMAAARTSGSLPPPSWTPARRYRLFGRTDPNEDIIRYAEAWERKIELNMTFDMIGEAVKLPHTDPMVTVAIRSDGSVEKVTFVQSSGVPVLDEAIRRIVDSLKPYQAFPPRLASEYDVLEIRRTWHFDMAIRLY